MRSSGPSVGTFAASRSSESAEERLDLSPRRRVIGRTRAEVLEQFDLATTPSGAAGFAALSRVAASREDRQRLRLGADSEVLVIVTEAALTAE